MTEYNKKQMELGNDKFCDKLCYIIRVFIYLFYMHVILHYSSLSILNYFEHHDSTVLRIQNH
jgi:hypothetical protein